jgi:hypothetical protein
VAARSLGVRGGIGVDAYKRIGEEMWLRLVAHSKAAELAAAAVFDGPEAASLRGMRMVKLAEMALSTRRCSPRHCAATALAEK